MMRSCGCPLLAGQPRAKKRMEKKFIFGGLACTVAAATAGYLLGSKSSRPDKPKAKKKSPNVVRVGVAVVLIDRRSNHILVGERKGSHGAGKWATPGGHLDFNESSWEECGRRELLEETGINVTSRFLEHFATTNDVMEEDGKHYITIWLSADWDGKQEPQLLEPDKCVSWHWLPIETVATLPLFRSMENMMSRDDILLPPPRTLPDTHKNVYLLMGFPGSGKGTQGKILAKKLGIQHVSTGELYRSEVKTGSELGKSFDYYMKRGEIVPSSFTFPYLEKEFAKDKYEAGLLLDGYPKDFDSLVHLKKTLTDLGYSIVGVIHFEVTRAVVTDRLCSRLLCKGCELNYGPAFKPRVADTCDKCGNPLSRRADDQPEAIAKRLDVYENSTKAVREYFSKCDRLFSIDASLPVKEVTAAILDLLYTTKKCEKVINTSYFMYPLEEKARSTVWHNHMDADNHDTLRELVTQVHHRHPQAQNKIYPIRDLVLGPQHASKGEFAHVYDCLPNFHSITNADNEAFTTGLMGDKLDLDWVRHTLEVCATQRGRGIMTEVEEDIYDAFYDKEGVFHLELDRGFPGRSDHGLASLGYEKEAIPDLPMFELHHGVDVPMIKGEDPPFSPSELLAALEDKGKGIFDNGAWFIFTKTNRWAYRTNEFSNADYEVAMKRLKDQAVALRSIVAVLLEEKSKPRPFKSTMALEIVHGMWRF